MASGLSFVQKQKMLKDHQSLASMLDVFHYVNISELNSLNENNISDLTIINENNKLKGYAVIIGNNLISMNNDLSNDLLSRIMPDVPLRLSHQ